MTKFVQGTGRVLLVASEETGATVMLFVHALRDTGAALTNPQRTLRQMKRVGVDSLPIAAAMAVFTGMVLALHTGSTLRKFDFEEATATIVAFSMIKEMGPVLTAMLLAGRVGASIAAEVGTMQINEEIDALYAMGISPIRYLVVPRLTAAISMLPVLVVFASAAGILGGAAVCQAFFDISYREFLDTAFKGMDFGDQLEGVIKALFFGAIVATIACRKGITTRGGAEGVGRAITSCVVTSFVCIFICNYFVTWVMV